MRRNIEFQSRGLTCRGWLYVPDKLGKGVKAPLIVMAHGFSGVKEMMLPNFAERFNAEGFIIMVFDFRYLGESDGDPRGHVIPWEQHEDYRSAITWASLQDEVDEEKIGIWGSSYSGGHALYLAAFDRRIKAAVAQVPAISGWRSTMKNRGREAVHGILAMALANRKTQYGKQQANYLPVVAPEGQPALLATPDAYAFFEEHNKDLAPNWINRVTVESLEKIMEYSPADAIELISPTPLLIAAAEKDSLIPIEDVREAFSRAGEPKKLLTMPCGHFDVYENQPWHGRVLEAEAEWFNKYLK
jgi:fermentation-respiration switch protein FrsA (DUF1100 family)